jgi:predicted RNA-binding protein with PIN domain
MPRTPEEVYAEIAAWPLADRLRLAARIIEEAARLAQTAGTGTRPSAAVPPTASPTVQQPAAQPTRPLAPQSKIQNPKSKIEPTRSLILVDGSNFLGTVAGFDLASDQSREELITRLQDFAHQHPTFRVTAYFDGQKSSVRRVGGVEVRFTPREKPADFFILQALRALTDEQRRHTLLVTADRDLADAARKSGAKIEVPTSFHRRLPGLKRTSVGERGLSANEVAAWEDYFQNPPDRGNQGRKK